MKPSPEIKSMLAPLAALQQIIDQFNHQGVIIGGIAVSLLGKPRLTADVDAVLLLSTDEIPQLLDVARQVGVSPRLTDVEEFARRQRVVLLKHDETGIPIDISLGLLPFEVEAIERGQIHHLESLSVRLPTPEDLIILKAVAHRPKDLLDIQTIVETHPQLNQERIEYWVMQFAEALEMPEVWDDVVKILRGDA
ncbi:nucleotidyl transferase AbiEii/AbiGii toxin family protein [Anaerolineales bacterium HSG6]|nr:nucleotidyl transferase AbiEii/AbiGii toxin family protein [Anaerolineales bacterium HSG6]